MWLPLPNVWIHQFECDNAFPNLKSTCYQILNSLGRYLFKPLPVAFCTILVHCINKHKQCERVNISVTYFRNNLKLNHIMIMLTAYCSSVWFSNLTAKP